jgi:hypothetical protein
MTIYGFKMKRGTFANLKSTGAVLREGEPVYLTDIRRMVVGDGVTQGYKLPQFLDDEHEAALAILNNTYRGVNLATKFAEEVADYSGNAWKWIQEERINRDKVADLYPWDYILADQTGRTISDGTTSYNLPTKTHKMHIAGINTYKNYGYPSGCPTHIDFLSVSSTIGVNIPWQTRDFNNGSSAIIYPWRQSKLYACLNGVDNRHNDRSGNELGFDASSGGVLQSLPQYLQDNIAMKRMFADSRYSGSGDLTESTAGDVDDVGKIWVPREVEVYGFPCNSQQKDGNGVNRSAYGSIQYPIFANNNAKQEMGRVDVWLSSVAGGSSSRACSVSAIGFAGTFECTYAWNSAWVGFRLQKQS